MSAEQEIILIQPSFKAYAEFIAVGVIFLLYDPLVALLIFLGIWWHKATRRYEISPDRIVFSKGLVMKSSRTLRIARIRDVSVRQNALQKPFDIGDVIVFTADKAEQPLRIKGIPYPVQLSKLLRKYYKELREAAAAASAAPVAPVAEGEAPANSAGE